MWIIRGLQSYPSEPPPAVVALGTFDGVHLAHRAVLETTLSRARALGVTAVVATFDPHPTVLLRPAATPLPITTLEERLALIAAAGIDGTIVIEFTRDLAAIEAETFVERIVAGTLRAREVVVGFNHTFGRGAEGNAALLTRLGDRLGFRTHVTPAQVIDGVPVSSSRIRTELRAGNVEQAAQLLGRPYSIRGKVVRGVGRGRTLGFPTANLEPERPPLVKSGVYSCDAEVDPGSYPAVVNVGVRPTFGGEATTVEAHLLDFSGDMYGKTVSLRFLRRLRDETRFPSAQALREQIALDIARARQMAG